MVCNKRSAAHVSSNKTLPAYVPVRVKSFNFETVQPPPHLASPKMREGLILPPFWGELEGGGE